MDGITGVKRLDEGLEMDASDDGRFYAAQIELEHLTHTLDILDRVKIGTTTADDAAFLAAELGIKFTETMQ